MATAGYSSARPRPGSPFGMRTVLTEDSADLSADDVERRRERPSGRGFLFAPLLAFLALGGSYILWRQLREQPIFSVRTSEALGGASSSILVPPQEGIVLQEAVLDEPIWGGLRLNNEPIFSVRVAKALGSRGYDHIRLSVVRDAQPVSERLGEAGRGWLSDLFRGKPQAPSAEGQHVDWTYTSEFRERWTHMHLSSAVVPVVPGETQTFDVYGQPVRVKVPRKGEGVVGLVVSDVCFEGLWPCKYGAVFDTKNTLLSVIHALVKHDELDYWMNVGDLFYDPNGNQNLEFFSGLSLEAQAKIHTMTVGNHEYWFNGHPTVCHPEWYGDNNICGVEHNLGFGFMQWYAQDAMSAKENSAQPFHFHSDRSPGEVAHFSNFFWYNMVGNVALISFSGLSNWELQKRYFEEACDWAQAQDPALLVLLGHWSKVNYGAAEGMATPEVYEKMMAIPGCTAIGFARAKFIDGHEHCNKISQVGTGFQFGGFGVHGCGNFGIPILDTRNGQAILWYFPLGAHGFRDVLWQDVIDCLETKGFSSCTQYAEIWMQQSLSPLPT